MTRSSFMTKAIDAAVAVSFLAFVPGCHNKPQEVNYKDLGWENEKFTMAGKPFTGIASEKHKNGQPKNRWEIKDGVPHGVVREWHENGQLMVETHYENNKRHGLNRYWAADGQLFKEQVYEHGVSVSVKEYPVKK